MPTIEIAELHARTAEVLADVAQHGAEYVVTDGGRVVAVVTPPAEVSRTSLAAVEAWLGRAAAIGAGLESGRAESRDIATVIAEQRR